MSELYLHDHDGKRVRYGGNGDNLISGCCKPKKLVRLNLNKIFDEIEIGVIENTISNYILEKHGLTIKELYVEVDGE